MSKHIDPRLVQSLVDTRIGGNTVQLEFLTRGDALRLKNDVRGLAADHATIIANVAQTDGQHRVTVQLPRTGRSEKLIERLENLKLSEPATMAGDALPPGTIPLAEITRHVAGGYRVRAGGLVEAQFIPLAGISNDKQRPTLSKRLTECLGHGVTVNAIEGESIPVTLRGDAAKNFTTAIEQKRAEYASAAEADRGR